MDRIDARGGPTAAAAGDVAYQLGVILANIESRCCGDLWSGLGKDRREQSSYDRQCGLHRERGSQVWDGCDSEIEICDTRSGRNEAKFEQSFYQRSRPPPS